MQGEPEDPLIEWLKVGKVEAWELLIQRYEDRLLKFIRRKLPDDLRPRVDAEDVVQEVFRSIVVRVKAGTFQCDNDQRLWQILRVRATKRLRGELRKHFAAKRSVGRECNDSCQAISCETPTYEQPDNHAGPERITISKEEIATLADRLPVRAQGGDIVKSCVLG